MLLCEREHNLARDDGCYYGSTIASDESTPNSNKYCALRFQVTYCYSLVFEKVERWESPEFEAQYPFRRLRHLTDIVNVHLKTGAETLKVIERQVARLGVYRYDLIGGTGDGGGENEGCAGVHSLLEQASNSYVRRRCFGHLPWRVADAGIRAMPHGELTEAINVYLRDGVTWIRLGAIACQSPQDGGLGLMRHESREYYAIFGASPPVMIEDRPECTAQFLKWLCPKQRVLLQCIQVDLQQRNLKIKQAARALETLADRKQCVLRHIDAVLVHKGLYLFHATQKMPYIVEAM